LFGTIPILNIGGQNYDHEEQADRIVKRVFIRPRYVKAERFVLAPLPPQPIEQGICTVPAGENVPPTVWSGTEPEDDGLLGGTSRRVVETSVSGDPGGFAGGLLPDFGCNPVQLTGALFADLFPSAPDGDVVARLAQCHCVAGTGTQARRRLTSGHTSYRATDAGRRQVGDA